MRNKHTSNIRIMLLGFLIAVGTAKSSTEYYLSYYVDIDDVKSSLALSGCRSFNNSYSIGHECISQTNIVTRVYNSSACLDAYLVSETTSSISSAFDDEYYRCFPIDTDIFVPGAGTLCDDVPYTPNISYSTDVCTTYSAEETIIITCNETTDGIIVNVFNSTSCTGTATTTYYTCSDPNMACTSGFYPGETFYYLVPPSSPPSITSDWYYEYEIDLNGIHKLQSVEPNICVDNGDSTSYLTTCTSETSLDITIYYGHGCKGQPITNTTQLEGNILYGITIINIDVPYFNHMAKVEIGDDNLASISGRCADLSEYNIGYVKIRDCGDEACTIFDEIVYLTNVCIDDEDLENSQSYTCISETIVEKKGFSGASCTTLTSSTIINTTHVSINKLLSHCEGTNTSSVYIVPEFTAPSTTSSSSTTTLSAGAIAGIVIGSVVVSLGIGYIIHRNFDKLFRRGTRSNANIKFTRIPLSLF
jgi:hypothetical protein